MKTNSIKDFMLNYEKNFIVLDTDAIETGPWSKQNFYSIFKSRKSNVNQSVYFEFYNSLLHFINDQNDYTYNELKNIFKDKRKKDILNKTFGESRNFLDFKGKNFKEFILSNKENILLDKKDFNKNFYLNYLFTKRRKDIKENSDTLRRLLRATGIFEIKNNIITLANRDLWKEYLKEVNFSQLIFNSGKSSAGEFYEQNNDSPLFKVETLNGILDVSKDQIRDSIKNIQRKLNIDSIDKIKESIVNSNNESFKKFIKKNFPLSKVTSILSMFKDRNNDSEIKKQVGIEETSIPTIYEYLVGIAWFYLSNEDYDVFSSFNLTMNANFYPETHAGGGLGDIVIHYKKHTLMLEVTLMNKNAQKRGEWEPVLRHATNLTTEQHPNKVRTLFIADELDENTINIWRAVASVPMKSTSGSNEYADSVVIMPLSTSELIDFINNSVKDNDIYKKIDESYDKLFNNFDNNWRKDIINSIK